MEINSIRVQRLGFVRTNSFSIFLKSMVERFSVAYENTIPTMIILIQYPVEVVVNVTACMVMPTEMGKHLLRTRNEKRTFYMIRSDENQLRI